MPGPPCRFRGDGARRPTGDVDGGSEKVQVSRLPVSPPARPVVVEIMPSVLHDCARAPPHSPARRARRASPCSPRIGVRFTGARASRCSADAKPEQPACGPLGRFRPRRRNRCLTASPGGRCPPRQSRAGDAGAPLRRRTRRPDAPPASEDGGAPPSSPSRSGPVRRHRRAPPSPPSFPPRPMFTSPSRPVRVSRASVCRVPSTKATRRGRSASVGLCTTNAPPSPSSSPRRPMVPVRSAGSVGFCIGLGCDVCGGLGRLRAYDDAVVPPRSRQPRGVGTSPDRGTMRAKRGDPVSLISKGGNVGKSQ